MEDIKHYILMLSPDGSLTGVLSGASETFARIIRKACSFRPENRFEDISLMKQALERCLRGEDFDITNLVEISEEEQQQLIRRKKRKKRTAAAVLIAAGLILFLVTAIVIQTGKTAFEIMLEESKDTERDIKNADDAVQKDNAIQQTDISNAIDYQNTINSTENAAVLIEMMASLEDSLKDRDVEKRKDFEKCTEALIYLDDTQAVGVSVNYKTITDEMTNTEKIYDLCSIRRYVAE